MLQNNNGQIQISSQYVIEALRQEASTLREHNIQLQAMLLQLQADAQREITSLQEQIKAHQEEVRPAAPESTQEPIPAPSPAGE